MTYILNQIEFWANIKQWNKMRKYVGMESKKNNQILM